MDNIAFSSASRLLDQLDRGHLSSRELLEIYLDRLDRFNPSLKAIIAFDPQARQNSLDRADFLDSERSAGRIIGPLHGLPITVKDSLEFTGLPCTSGVEQLKDYHPPTNADAVQSLLDAGALIFGKTNLPVLAGDFQTFNQLHGQTVNPWNPEYSPGGSSGGSAAALAAGLTSLELGSDIGGSLRNPAAFCGVFSHKPSHGIVPSRGHIPPSPNPLLGDYPQVADISVCGPLARSTQDLELALNLLTAPEADLRPAWRLELPPARHSTLKDFKVGLMLDDPACPVDNLVLDHLHKVVDRLARKGLRISENRPEVDFRRAFEIFKTLLGAVMGGGIPQNIFDKWLAMAPNLAEEDRSTLAGQIRGATLRHRDWLKLHTKRQIMRAKWAEFFSEYDALLCPVVPVARMEHDHSPYFERTLTVNGQARPYIEIAAWAGFSGVAYLPSTVIPTGLSQEGLPIGLQIVGPFLEDKTCLALAHLLEQELGGFKPPPGFE